MSARQLDLFAPSDDEAIGSSGADYGRAPDSLQQMDDDALIAAIARAGLGDAWPLAGEAGRRRLAAAVPALEALCRRFIGFGGEHIVPEQAAALAALAEIGGSIAAEAVARLIERSVIHGPGLRLALSAAARLSALLSNDVLRTCLNSADPGIRAEACRCVGSRPAFPARLIAMLRDPDRTVALSAACALGQMGRTEALPLLEERLERAPSADVIDAVAGVADERCMVLLGRIARSPGRLASKALAALESIDQPRAQALVRAIRRDASAVASS